MNKPKAAIKYVLTTHLLALSILSLLRIIFLIANLNFLENTSYQNDWIFSAFVRGLWFDNVIVSYISIIPITILFVLSFCNVLNKSIIRFFNWFYTIFFGVVFAISAADIPYFSYFFKHLNASIFNWKEEGSNATQMILQESSYYIYFVLYVIVLIVFAFTEIQIGRKTYKQCFQKHITSKQYVIYLPICVLLIGLCILGIRGRFGRNPIKTSQAYFCNNSFINQLGINPTFFLMRSIIENNKKHIGVNELMSIENAITIIQESLNITLGQASPTPVFRHIEGISENKNINVVIILMESMSSELLKQKNGNLTPFLNELKNESYYFDNFYSTGNHTNQGITATLFGLPSLFDKNMMKDVDIPLCQGLPTTLKKRGYKTLFFVTHESQYDNMNAFLLENGIETIFSQEDYPKSKVVNGFGVQDDYLFEYAINKLNEYDNMDSPFFAGILTISNHPPYIVPDKYKYISDDPQEQIVAFTDDALKQFMNTAKQQPWYDNTIFVLLGDHGKIVGTPIYDMPLSYNHIPLIIHSKLLKDCPKTINNLGGQIDVFPTIMGLLDYSYDNNSLGTDIINNKRKFISFTSDNMLGCVNNDYLYIYNPNSKSKTLYNYRLRSTLNEVSSHATLVDNMQNYASSMLIMTDFLLKNKLTRSEN